MYHHHHACRSPTSQYNASLSLAPQPPHAFILCNCPFSLSALSILFSLVPGDGAWVTRWLVECFRVLVQSGYPCPPRSPRSLQFFRIDRNLPSLSPRLNEHSPRTCDPHHLFPFIFTRLTYHSPPRPPHLLPPIPSNIESTP